MTTTTMTTTTMTTTTIVVIELQRSQMQAIKDTQKL